jgi:hypothetical protein
MAYLANTKAQKMPLKNAPKMPLIYKDLSDSHIPAKNEKRYMMYYMHKHRHGIYTTHPYMATLLIHNWCMPMPMARLIRCFGGKYDIIFRQSYNQFI